MCSGKKAVGKNLQKSPFRMPDFSCDLPPDLLFNKRSDTRGGIFLKAWTRLFWSSGKNGVCVRALQGSEITLRTECVCARKGAWIPLCIDFIILFCSSSTKYTNQRERTCKQAVHWFCFQPLLLLLGGAADQTDGGSHLLPATSRTLRSGPGSAFWFPITPGRLQSKAWVVLVWMSFCRCYGSTGSWPWLCQAAWPWGRFPASFNPPRLFLRSSALTEEVAHMVSVQWTLAAVTMMKLKITTGGWLKEMGNCFMDK
jgi:hypothetical protein